MIIKAIINGLTSLLFGIVPTIEFNIPAFNAGNQIYYHLMQGLRVILYILPQNTVVTILTIIISILGLRIAISLIKTIWDLIPLL